MRAGAVADVTQQPRVTQVGSSVRDFIRHWTCWNRETEQNARSYGYVQREGVSISVLQWPSRGIRRGFLLTGNGRRDALQVLL